MTQHAEYDQTDDVLAIARGWPALLFVGVITVVLGVVVLAWPSETLVVLSVLLGLQFLVFGLMRLIGAFSGDTAPIVGFVGVLLMISGVIVLRNPYETVAVLATILGVVWIVVGCVDVIDAFANRQGGIHWMQILTGALSVVAGILVVSWPAPTLSVIAWIAGLYMIVFGLFIVASAFSLRKVADA